MLAEVLPGTLAELLLADITNWPFDTGEPMEEFGLTDNGVEAGLPREVAGSEAIGFDEAITGVDEGG